MSWINIAKVCLGDFNVSQCSIFPEKGVNVLITSFQLCYKPHRHIRSHREKHIGIHRYLRVLIES